MQKNKNSSRFSTTDIQKYLEGRLSAPEMHAIEKAALNDPFLADALEGMQTDLQKRNNASFNTDVTELNKRLQERINKNNKTAIIPSNKLWQRVAAAAIILIGSTALIYNYVIKPTDKNKAVSVRKDEKFADSSISNDNSLSAPMRNDSTIVTDPGGIKKRAPQESKPKQTFKKKSVSAKKTAIKEKNVSNYKQTEVDKKPNLDLLKDEERQRKTIVTIKADTLKTDSLKEQMTASVSSNQFLQGKVAGISISPNKQYKNNFVQGVVVDNYKNPVSGATVMLKDRKTATSTDNNGFFKLKTDDKEKMSNVVVNSLGFESTTIFLDNKNDSTILIQLQPSTSALNEVVVVGYAAKKDDDTDKEESASAPKKEKEISYKAEPAIGWPAFNDYILQNKKITTADSVKKGKEIITFFVNTAHQLSSFKIRKSLSRAHDAETIRLMKQGPPWKLLKGKKVKVTLAFEF